MSDMPPVDKAKAAVRQKETFLNSNGGAGQKVQSSNQGNGIKKPIGHVDPYRK